MKSCRWRAVVAVLAAVLATQGVVAETDREGCADYPLLNRLEGFYIEGCKEETFTSYRFMTEDGKKPVEGHYRRISYRLADGAPDSSGLEMIRNHTNAVEAIGGEVMYQGRYSGSMRVVAGDREVWIEVSPYGNRAYRLDIVEKEAMVQQVVADADALLAGLDRSGHVVLHGVFFDTDTAVVTPESEAALAEIAKLLEANPEMTAFVVGHTDMSGSLGHNMELSERRAGAVVEALVTGHGIAAKRLTPRGVGPLAPVGSNDSEAGRALNRRVELVKR